MNRMAIAHQRWMRSPIIKAWRDRTRTIQVLADLVCAWAAADETTIHLDVVAFRNVQQLDARMTVLADKRIMEVPTETKLSWIARSLGVATRQARISGRLRSPKDLEQLFPGDSIWEDDFALYSSTSDKEVSSLDAFLEGGSDVEWFLLQITGSHDWLLGALDEHRFDSMLGVAREVFERHGAKLQIA